MYHQGLISDLICRWNGYYLGELREGDIFRTRRLSPRDTLQHNVLIVRQQPYDGIVLYRFVLDEPGLKYGPIYAKTNLSFRSIYYYYSHQ